MAQRITGHTDIYGIIANPIRHTISPMMHNTAFEALGIDGVYVAFETREDKFNEAVRGLLAMGIKGFNVSMPYKRAVMDYLDELSPAAKLCQAVNTVVRRDDGTYAGYLTDGIGFVQSLKERGFDIRDKKIVLLGKGGAATAIGVQAALDGAREICIFNRSDAGELAQLLRENTGCRSESYRITELKVLKEVLADADLLINATSVGMGAMKDRCLIPDASYLRKGLWVADIVYNPAETVLLKMAVDAGCTVVNGLGMLLYQGAEAFRLWTGREMPMDEVRKAAFPNL